MNNQNNTDKIEAFLFELNELLRRHKATLEAHGFDELAVRIQKDACVFVEKNGEHGYLELAQT